MGDNGSPFSTHSNGGMNGNPNGGGGRSGSEGGLGPPPFSGSNFPFPTSAPFGRPTSFPPSTFQTTASSAVSQTNALGSSQTSASSSSGLEDATINTNSGLNGGIIAAIVIIILLFISLPIALFFYRHNQRKSQHRKSIGAPPSSHLPLYEYFTARSISSNRNSFEDIQRRSVFDAKPLPPNPEEHPTFRVSIPPPGRAHLRSSFAMTERSMSVYSDTNLYFITSKEIGIETRLPSRGGERLSRLGVEVANDNPYRVFQMPSRLSRLGIEEEGDGNPFETPLASPVGSPKFMIGEGKWRRPYKGKLRPGMGVQRALTPSEERAMEEEEERLRWKS
ncbi:hypothetical protein N431DRAFT_497233 [Stipitochalara longipes BDJ]|nr:hypothetical protein N431DRAFT_497233 [Stipitochalara longipes BDJ]